MPYQATITPGAALEGQNGAAGANCMLQPLVGHERDVKVCIDPTMFIHEGIPCDINALDELAEREDLRRKPRNDRPEYSRKVLVNIRERFNALPASCSSSP